MIRFHDAVKPLLVPAGSLRPNPRNANNGDIDAVVESLLVNGCYRPVYTDRDGEIVAGHNLYAGLLLLGEPEVPQMVVDGDKTEVLRMLVADNQIARLSRDDPALLLDLLGELEQTEKRFLGTGFSEETLPLLDDAPLDLKDFDPFGSQSRKDHTCPNCGCVFMDERG